MHTSACFAHHADTEIGCTAGLWYTHVGQNKESHAQKESHTQTQDAGWVNLQRRWQTVSSVVNMSRESIQNVGGTILLDVLGFLPTFF